LARIEKKNCYRSWTSSGPMMMLLALGSWYLLYVSVFLVRIVLITKYDEVYGCFRNLRYSSFVAFDAPYAAC